MSQPMHEEQRCCSVCFCLAQHMDDLCCGEDGYKISRNARLPYLDLLFDCLQAFKDLVVITFVRMV